jgi:hypothetical protein
VRWIMGCSHHTFYRVVGWWKAGSQGEGGSGGGTLMTPVMGYGNGEGEAMGCDRFQRGRGGGGEVAPRCQRQMTQQNVATGVWRSKITKGN